MRGRDLFRLLSPVIGFAITCASVLPRRVLIAMFRAARSAPGLPGIGVRFVLLSAVAQSVGNNVSIRDSVHLHHIDRLRVGTNVSIHPMCYIDACGGITIGDDVSIAHGTTIMSSTHAFEALDVPINDQGVTLAETAIEGGCWIGAQAVIVAGVRVGQGSVVGANSVVTHDVPAGSVVAGSPARIVRSRTGGP